MNHDMIVIGASGGGVPLLLELAGSLSADIAASMFVVVHYPPDRESLLPELLSHRGPLPAKHPLHDEKIERGHIYVAPPDNHLLVRQGTMEVVRGPKENGHRPAADALFRTAANVYGPRVVGVVLSGYQDCGTAGMLSVRARGGVTVVQDPRTAKVPEMPQSVLDATPVDHVVAPQELPALLARLAATPVRAAAPLTETIRQLEGSAPGQPAELPCPTCGGTLDETRAGRFDHFRCHVGHTFTLDALIREQSEHLERALWAAVRSLEESAALARRLANAHKGELRSRFQEKASSQQREAELIRNMLVHGSMLTHRDSKE